MQDVEPSVRVDTLGNVFPGAIRGVPAGVDLWRVFAPYGSTDFEYLGQPDGTFAADPSFFVDFHEQAEGARPHEIHLPGGDCTTPPAPDPARWWAVA